MLARQQLAAANAHQRDRRIVAVARVADDVAVAAVDRQHDRRFVHRLEMPERVAQLGRALEVERGRRVVHALAHASRHFVRTPLEKDEHLVDHRAYSTCVCAKMHGALQRWMK